MEDIWSRATTTALWLNTLSWHGTSCAPHPRGKTQSTTQPDDCVSSPLLLTAWPPSNAEFSPIQSTNAWLISKLHLWSKTRAQLIILLSLLFLGWSPSWRTVMTSKVAWSKLKRWKPKHHLPPSNDGANVKAELKVWIDFFRGIPGGWWLHENLEAWVRGIVSNT